LEQDTGGAGKSGPNTLSVGLVLANELEVVQGNIPFFSAVHHDAVVFHLDFVGTCDIV